jgi:hypothetical protein
MYKKIVPIVVGMLRSQVPGLGLVRLMRRDFSGKGLSRFPVLGFGVAVAVCALPLIAPANDAQFGAAPTNLPEVRAFPKPPAGFNPAAAPEMVRAQFGFPPAPDAKKSPEAYAAWQRAVTAPHRRLENPTLQHTGIFHGPARIRPSSETRSAENNTVVQKSSNWSGNVIVDGGAPFRGGHIYAYFIVPTAQQPFGTCSGSWDYSAQWLGIDGYGSNDVLQAGTEADAFCAGGSTSSFYGAWIEWFPADELLITNFNVAPGDVMFVEVWNVGPTEGRAYLHDVTQQEAVSLAFSAPPGTRLKGNSAEWVVERPDIVGSGTATLSNYLACSFSYCYATGAPGLYPAGGGPTGTLFNLQMVNGAGQVLSYPTLVGNSTLWFWDSGPAR